MVLKFHEVVSFQEEFRYAKGPVKGDVKVSIVGQEKDRTVLFSWSGTSSFSEDKMVSYIGMKEATNTLSQVIYEHYEDIRIVGASINAARTLIAFTTVSKVAREYCQLADFEDIYSSYVAEIHPQGRCFTLDVNRTHYQRVQFLYVTLPGKQGMNESYLLCMLHGENIGLYTFSLCRLPGSDTGIVLLGNPRIKEVCKAFHWYQWDAVYQRLYVVCFRPKKPPEGILEPAMWCFEFLNDKPLIVMDLPLPFLFKEDQAVNRPSYLSVPGFRTLPEKHINLEVVSLPGVSSCGSLFLCYQHPSSNDSEVEHKGKDMIVYSICMLHHEHVLKGQIRDVIQERKSSRLLFCSLNDYVVVLLPGVALHLLNCSAEHAPVHHILLHDVGVPQFPSASTSSCFCQWETSIDGTANVLDTVTLKEYHISFDQSALAHVFKATHLTATKLAIMHMALVHLNDELLVKMLLRELCLDSTHPDCSQLLSDYLIGASYTYMKFNVLVNENSLLQLLPLTETDRFRGHLEMDRQGREVARITYVLLPDVEEGLAKGGDSSDVSQDKGVVQLKTYPQHTNPFASLLENLYLNKQRTPRFSLKTFADRLSEKSNAVVGNQEEEEEVPRRSMFRRMSDSFRFRTSSQLRASQHKPLSFLEPASEQDPRESRHQKLLIRSLQNHFKQNKGLDTGSLDKDEKYSKVAQRYASTQMKQSEGLLQSIWNLLGYDDENHPAQTSLYNFRHQLLLTVVNWLHFVSFICHREIRGNARDSALFYLAERFYASVERCGFPFPGGFHFFFTCIGFRCLHPQLFLQYVNCHVFHLSNDFLIRLISELGDDPASTEVKFQILWRLNPLQSASLLTKCVRAGHKEASSLLSQQRVSKLLAEGDNGNFSSPRQQQGRSDTEQCDDMSPEIKDYKPLDYLMKTLQARQRQMADAGSNSGEAESASLDLIQKYCCKSFKAVVDSS
ncbi:protein pigeon-like isoform X2 [Corticium candelabrum]|uniref:protein pigeon-like isoform X2 n=1 Tax=Corticium candelabrum TaxID=121492 RepID=UPI002E354677|nr:protein pigeon-like isoform X2 [Corticium candelabrum]